MDFEDFKRKQARFIHENGVLETGVFFGCQISSLLKSAEGISQLRQLIGSIRWLKPSISLLAILGLTTRNSAYYKLVNQEQYRTNEILRMMQRRYF